MLSDEEVARFAIGCDRLSYPFGPLFMLLLLTAQRRAEVAEMRWSELDLEAAIWTIPGSRAKNGTSHTVPLSPGALELLRSLPRITGSDFLFTTNGVTPVSGFSKAKRQIDARTGSEGWRLHDLRPTAASGMARLGVDPHVIEKVINHTSGTISGVAAVYNRYGYTDEKRSALCLWWEHIKGVSSAKRDVGFDACSKFQNTTCRTG